MDYLFEPSNYAKNLLKHPQTSFTIEFTNLDHTYKHKKN